MSFRSWKVVMREFQSVKVAYSSDQRVEYKDWKYMKGDQWVVETLVEYTSQWESWSCLVLEHKVWVWKAFWVAKRKGRRAWEEV